MPLRATIDGRQVIAPLLTEAQWEALRADVAARNLRVVLACCDREGYLRRSARGVQHFAHKRAAPGEGETCDHAGETLEHLAAKAAIVQACDAAGYQAAPEIAGEGWRADVLARPKASLKTNAVGENGATLYKGAIAFEVQWSHLSLEDCDFRQKRYAADGVRGCWFFRNPPPELGTRRADPRDLFPRRDLPLFPLHGSADRQFTVSINRRLVPLGDFVQALLERQVRFCETAMPAGAQTARGALVPIACPACRRLFTFWHVEAQLTARCGVRVLGDTPWLTLALLPDAVQAGRAAGVHERALAVPEPSAEGGAGAFRCPHCNAAHGQPTLDRALYGTAALATAYDTDAFTFPLVLRAGGGSNTVAQSFPHWCWPEDGHFCGGL